MKNRAQTTLHPTAIVHPQAKIGRNVNIGPYCIVGKDVTIHANTVLKSHVNIEGKTTIGEHCTIYPFASLGTIPQDLKYHGESAELIIGNHNTIREHVTMNIGTSGDQGKTLVGDHCLFMVGSHVAHDCVIGDHVILANNASLAGHVSIGNHAIIGGLAGIHQFVRIGEHAMVGGVSAVAKDVIPFGIVKGDRAQIAGLNLVGLKRRGFNRSDINDLRNAFKVLFHSPESFENKIEKTRAMYPNCTLVNRLLTFIAADTKRNLITECVK